MKRIIKYASIFVICLLALTGCNSKVKNYYLVDGDLYVAYENDKVSNLGTWNEEMKSSFSSITVSEDGYYVIDGIKTSILSKVIVNYTIDENGHLKAVYSDSSTEDLGDLTNNIANVVKTITISENGHYVINGIETAILAYNVYTVSFNAGFSANIKTQSVRNGEKVTEPEVTRDGYTFNGWFYNGEPWSFENDTVSKDITLTAKWIENVYNVSFVNSKGTAPSTMSITFGKNCYIQEPGGVSGFIFDGWYYNDTKIEFGSKWNIASDVTLTAKWTEIVTSYDTTFDSVSVSNLTINGLTSQMVIKENKNTDCSFTVTDSERSLVFKFYYDVLDDTANESNAVRIHFDASDDKWDTNNCLWFRGDRIFMSSYESATSSIILAQSPALEKGAHSIEFGRLAVLENGKETVNIMFTIKLMEY